MQKELTDFLNWSRRWTISGVQNVTLYCKIDTIIQLFRWVYKWSLAQMLYKTLDPCFYIQYNPRYQPLKNRLLYSALGWLWTLVSQQRIKILKYKKSVFNLGSSQYSTKISIICLKQKVWKWLGQTLGAFLFSATPKILVQKWGKFEPLYLRNDSRFGKI